MHDPWYEKSVRDKELMKKLEKVFVYGKGSVNKCELEKFRYF